MQETMFIDPQRYIGCRACVAACRECSTHKGYSMIFVDHIDRSASTAREISGNQSPSFSRPFWHFNSAIGARFSLFSQR